MDYFTKWVEAEPLATITEQKIRNFVWRSIICKFCIPRALVSDNGKQFDNLKFRDFCAELGIKKYYSSLAHPQSNGQAEVTIRTLKAALKTKLEDLKGRWVKYLPEVLWAYRTACKSTAQFVELNSSGMPQRLGAQQLSLQSLTAQEGLSAQEPSSSVCRA